MTDGLLRDGKNQDNQPRTPTQNRMINNIRAFVEDCFEDNRYNENKVYLKKPSDKACKWCPFNDNPKLCDKENKGISQFSIK